MLNGKSPLRFRAQHLAAAGKRHRKDEFGEWLGSNHRIGILAKAVIHVQRCGHLKDDLVGFWSFSDGLPVSSYDCVGKHLRRHLSRRRPSFIKTRIVSLVSSGEF